MNETALTVVPEQGLTEWGLLIQQAKTFIASGFLPRELRTPEQVVAVILQGREVGIGPMAALNNISVINNKPTLSVQLMLALFHRSGQAEMVDILSEPEKCTVKLKRKGQPPYVSVFTRDDAERLGLTTRDQWRKQMGVMLKWRAIAAGLRVVAPDICLGMYTADEMGSDGPGRNMVVMDSDSGEILYQDEPAAPSNLDALDAVFEEKEVPATPATTPNDPFANMPF